VKIVLLWLAILATLAAFGKISRAAGGLMVLYLFGVTNSSLGHLRLDPQLRRLAAQRRNLT
jgi:tryptophan-rich sensory protein